MSEHSFKHAFSCILNTFLFFKTTHRLDNLKSIPGTPMDSGENTFTSMALRLPQTQYCASLSLNKESNIYQYWNLSPCGENPSVLLLQYLSRVTAGVILHVHPFRFCAMFLFFLQDFLNYSSLKHLVYLFT